MCAYPASIILINLFVFRKAQTQQIQMKAKKIDIDFDSIGNVTQNKEVSKGEEKKVELPQKNEKIMPNISDKLKNMKAISSTDYEYFIVITSIEETKKWTKTK